MKGNIANFSRRRITAWVIAGLLATSSLACAQSEKTLYTGLSRSKGYVVGAKLNQSGFHAFAGDTNWTHIGWNHPRVSAVAFDPVDPQTIYLAGGNGVLRTRDGGETWRIVTDWRQTELQDVIVDQEDPDRIYMACAYGIWKSPDRGDTWIESNNGLKRKYTQRLLIDAEDHSRLLAATEGGIYESTDQAESWNLVGPPDIQANSIAQSATDPSTWNSASEGHGVMISRDGGKTWSEAGSATEGLVLYTADIDPFDANNMAAVGFNSGVVVSQDGGATWERRGDSLPTPHFYQVTFDHNVPGRIWVATIEEGIFYSEDMGMTWTSAGMWGTLVFDFEWN